MAFWNNNTNTKSLNEEPQPMAMLKRDELSSVPTASGDLNALLGRGSEFEGKLTFEGTVRIDGKFNGNIVTNDVLVVGEGAKIQAEISCGTTSAVMALAGKTIKVNVMMAGCTGATDGGGGETGGDAADASDVAGEVGPQANGAACSASAG
jgi:hypothetical protein